MNFIRRLNRENFIFETSFQICWLIRRMVIKKYKIFSSLSLKLARPKKHRDMGCEYLF